MDDMCRENWVFRNFWALMGGEDLNCFFMSMVRGNKATVFLLQTLFLLWLCNNTCDSFESDIQCLRDLKDSLSDPYNSLSSWDFSNTSEGFICKFNGIECWDPGESKVLNIRLSSMRLKGQFPTGLESCTSMTGLDLSYNELSGSIPPDIGKRLPYVTTLDLSYNKFSGDIPIDIANMIYLHALNLQHNELEGQIPQQFQNLSHLTSFNVANNSLSGEIPSFRFPMLWSSFSNNSGICGKPLDACKRHNHHHHHHHHSIIVRLAVSAGSVVILAMVVACFFYLRRLRLKSKEEDIEGNKREHTARRYCNVHISMFEKTVPKMRLHYLLKATNSFSQDNVIGAGRAGTMYKATLPVGSFLAIKRFDDSQHSDEEFKSEMTMLGHLKHRNVVPLLGFCISRNERLLIYKYMPNGTLYQQLHGVKTAPGFMEWPMRLRIAIGVARGLAWLHHSCDPCIIHRDINSKHILLDGDYEPQVSNFRTAKLMSPLEDHSSSVLNFESRYLGYMAPEFRNKVVASREGDIFSLGVVLLELITGQKPNKVVNAPKGFKGNLVEWITYLKNNSLLSYAFDRSLVGTGCDGELLRFLRVAVACVAYDPEERPTMIVVCQFLQSIGKRYNFLDEDERQNPQKHINMDVPDEFNVGRQVHENQQNDSNLQRTLVDNKMRKAASF